MMDVIILTHAADSVKNFKMKSFKFNNIYIYENNLTENKIQRYLIFR